MVETIQAQNINLYDLKYKFGLERADNNLAFFPEWQNDLPGLTDFERQMLDEVREEHRHLSFYPMLEPVVKLVVLSPLLKLAGFYRSPFYLSAEKEVQIVSVDEGTVVRGRLDLLVFTPEFWIMVIEAKKTQYSLEVGIPQALTYMVGKPDLEKPAFGLVTNGLDFVFLKLLKQDTIAYAESDRFSLGRTKNELYDVLQILKHLSQLAICS